MSVHYMQGVVCAASPRSRRYLHDLYIDRDKFGLEFYIQYL